MSGSSDCTIRVWSLDTADEVDRISTKEPVFGLGTIIGKNDLYSFGSKSIELWRIEHVHSVFAAIGLVGSLRTADVFPVVASLPTGNTSAVRRLVSR